MGILSVAGWAVGALKWAWWAVVLLLTVLIPALLILGLVVLLMRGYKRYAENHPKREGPNQENGSGE